MAISPSRRLLYLGRHVMCASAAAQECPRRAPFPLCPRSPPRRCQIHPALRSYMRLHADPRCMRSTSSDPVLALRTGRKFCPGYNTYSTAHLGAPIVLPTCEKFRSAFEGLAGLKSGPGLNVLHRRRRLLRHHRFCRYHGQHTPPPHAARRAAARAGCRLQLKIYMPYVFRAGGLALSTNEISRWPGRPVGLMVGRVWGSTPRGGTAVGSPL